MGQIAVATTIVIQEPMWVFGVVLSLIKACSKITNAKKAPAM